MICNPFVLLCYCIVRYYIRYRLSIDRVGAAGGDVCYPRMAQVKQHVFFFVETFLLSKSNFKKR